MQRLVNKFEISNYTYDADDADGERIVRYVPGRLDAFYSANQAGHNDRLERFIYPSGLLTVKTLLSMNNQFKQIATYTKHYYIDAERISSVIGRGNGIGQNLLEPCDSSFPSTQDIFMMNNEKVQEAEDALQDDYQFFEKQLVMSESFSNRPGCFAMSYTGEHNAYWFHPDHLGSSSFISNKDGAISQHLEYFPFGETLVEEHKNSNNSPYKFNAKELDDETGNYYYGARYLNPKFSIWLSVDPLAEKYPGWSPYSYTMQNPVIFVDPDGRQIVGVTKKDARTFKADVHRVLKDEKFAKIRSLIDLKGSRFKKIDSKAMNAALDGITLSTDEKTYIDMVTNTINSKDIHKIEYLNKEFTSSEGAIALKDHMNKAQEGVGDMILTPEGKLSTGIIDNFGGGLNVPTKKGSHSFIGSGITGEDKRAVTSGHEVFGHGIPSAKNFKPKENNTNAIRADNLIRRLLDIPERDGSNHGGFREGHITEPNKLPITQ